MNLKTVTFGLLFYLGFAAFMVALHYTFSRNGLGNEFMLFGFPLVPLFLAGLKTTEDEISPTDVAAITLGCLLLSTISIPIHHMVPERFLNPYSGPVGVLLLLPMLCVMYFVYTYIIKPRQNAKDGRGA